MDIVLATNNMHKFKELKTILKDYTLHMPEEYGIIFNYEETGTAFFENAIGKALSLYSSLENAGKRIPVIADDSGLVVPALKGEPGIMSARYGSTEKGKKLSAGGKIDFLLSRMKGITDRRAYFVCCMILVAGRDRFFAAQETFHGEIAHSPEGTGGFGYDPVFFIPGINKTVSQLDDEQKNRISHRGKAGRRIHVLLKSLY